MEQDSLVKDLRQIVSEILEQSQLNQGDTFVLGCSTSEILGEHIGRHPSQEIGEWIVSTLKEELDKHGVYLAVQGCEHLNRALVVEAEVARENNWEVVSVLPGLHAGGSCSVAAFKFFDNPVEVEFITAQAGIDIGDTFIGMHVKHVQVPVRPTIKELGAAHVTALRSRPKYVGGPRANYEPEKYSKFKK